MVSSRSLFLYPIQKIADALPADIQPAGSWISSKTHRRSSGTLSLCSCKVYPTQGRIWNSGGGPIQRRTVETGQSTTGESLRKPAGIGLPGKPRSSTSGIEARTHWQPIPSHSMPEGGGRPPSSYAGLRPMTARTMKMVTTAPKKAISSVRRSNPVRGS
jgi:hypothetical protein